MEAQNFRGRHERHISGSIAQETNRPVHDEGSCVLVFAQGPIGLCTTAGAKLKRAGFIIAVESDPVRAATAKRMGADVVLDHTKIDAVEEIRRATKRQRGRCSD
jgi:threonine dehydrogenase-like Zn-dependent dehydrogenase